MKKAYLFDFDGTLVDSMPTFVSAMLRILDENRISYDNGIIKIITPLGLNGTAEYYINQLGVKMSKEQLMSVMKEYMLDACLKRLGLWALFDNVWSCDDFNTTKADPQIYVLAAKRLNRSVEEVLFLDDNLNADMTAKAAGMQVCGVYDESSKDSVEQIKAVTDYYIYDFLELLNLNIDKKGL